MTLNKKQLALYKKTKEGQMFIDELLDSLLSGFRIINGKIIDVEFKEFPVLDLDAIEAKIKKNRKEK